MKHLTDTVMLFSADIAINGFGSGICEKTSSTEVHKLLKEMHDQNIWPIVAGDI